MSAVAPTETSTAGEQHVLLAGVSWALYVELRQLPENRSKRMVYDRGGLLEIMTLSSFHERIVQLIARFIEEWTVAKTIDLIGCGSMTLQRESLGRGLEPDRCYYLNNANLVRDRQQLDVTVDPAPDLVIEVDHTSGSLDKMAIYAAFDVPEIWRWKEENLSIYVLSGDAYSLQDFSRCLPGFPLELLNAALAQRHQRSETELVKRFRATL